ncbi:MAG: tetratricopeptide repeat protein, partial [Asticcacaulis sp.]
YTTQPFAIRVLPEGKARPRPNAQQRNPSPFDPFRGLFPGFDDDEPGVSVSTRDALAAARAAVRAATMEASDRGPLGGLKSGANRSRTPPAPRPRDGSAQGSTFGQAVKASAVAVGAVAVMAGGLWYVQHHKAAKPAPAPAQDTPVAAAVLVPEAGLSAEYNEAMKLIEARSPGAVDRLKMVANQGYGPAQEMLGEIYYSGQDGLVTPDKAQAREWTEKAARGGMAKAMRLLAQMYYNGQGVETDRSMAAVWMRRAADRGDVNSAYNLGLLYQSGTGVPMNPTEAYKWMMVAAKLGDPEAPATAAQLKKQLTEAQIAKVHDDVENFKSLTDGEPINAAASGSASNG